MSRTDLFVRSASSAVLVLSGLLLLLPVQGEEPTVQGEAYALLVGVNTFDHSNLSELKYAENDVEALAKLLDKPGSPFHGRVRVLTCARGKKAASDKPTAANIRNAVRELTSKRTRQETVLVALASHGVELVVSPPGVKSRGGLTRPEGDSSPDDRIYPFVCPSDAQFEGTDYTTGNNERLINLNSLIINTLGKCGAGTKLLLMDACREHAKLPAARSLSVNYKEVPEGVAGMFSCKSGQLAYEDPRLKHGVFFHFIVKGLGGEAKDRASGKVTWDRLAVYVGEAMEAESKDYTGGKLQTPQRIYNLIGGSPVLARLDKSPLAKNDGPPDKSAIRPPRPGVQGAGKGIKNSIGMLLMPIPKGTFLMGSPTSAKRNKDEKQHGVEITKGYFMGAYEVTQEEYKTVMGSNPSAYSERGQQESAARLLDTRAFPVEGVNWADADTFCRTLSALPSERTAGRVYRLPTEAEWEFACRGGTRETRPFHFGNMLAVGQANFDCRIPFGGGESRNSLNQPCSVGNFESNVFGLYDMHGNVREWCSDWYDSDYYTNSPKSDPPGPNKGRYRVVRGGSWMQDGFYCRSTHRDKLDPAKTDNYTGFRVVCVVRP